MIFITGTPPWKARLGQSHVEIFIAHIMTLYWGEIHDVSSLNLPQRRHSQADVVKLDEEHPRESHSACFYDEVPHQAPCTITLLVSMHRTLQGASEAHSSMPSPFAGQWIDFEYHGRIGD